MLPCAKGCIALRRREPKAEEIALDLVDPHKGPVSGNNTAIAWSIKPPGSTAPGMPHGVAVHWRPSSSARPGASAGVRASAAPEKKGRKLLPPSRSSCSRPGCSRLRLSCTRRPRVPSAPWREHLALCRRHQPLALCPAPRGLVAPRAARAPPHTSAAPEPEQAGRSTHTPGVGALSYLEPPDQWGVAQCHGGGPVWDLQSLV